MAKFKPYKILSEQLENLPIIEGQYIVTTDDKKQYLDIDNETRIILNQSNLVYKGAWNSAIQYKVNDIVLYSSMFYIAEQNNSGRNPSTQASFWKNLNQIAKSAQTVTVTNAEDGNKRYLLGSTGASASISVTVPATEDNRAYFLASTGDYVFPKLKIGEDDVATKKYVDEQVSNISTDVEIPNSNLVNGEAEGSLRTLTTYTSSAKYAFATGDLTKAIGHFSHAEGHYSEATGSCSHAEGNDTRAIGSCSHAEGLATEANANRAHAEGNSTIASGEDSHAEGYFNIASGETAHAEGCETRALGFASHVEGTGTQANGDCSHAEGTVTVASGEFQHVQGKYNIEDTENKYAHIVGNGEYEDPHNAHTLDWEGNAWFAGNIKIGGESYDDDAREVLTSVPNANTTTVGGLKVRLDGTTLYITNNGRNP